MLAAVKIAKQHLTLDGVKSHSEFTLYWRYLQYGALELVTFINFFVCFMDNSAAHCYGSPPLDPCYGLPATVFGIVRLRTYAWRSTRRHGTVPSEGSSQQDSHRFISTLVGSGQWVH